MPDDKFTLTGLEVENIMRIRAVNLTMRPDGSVIVGGKNESGKTSFVRSAELVLAGSKAQMPDDPIHGNAKQGHIIARFDGMTVEKKFRRGRPPELVVKNAEGVPQKKPQTLIDALIPHVALDVLWFLRKTPLEQARIVTELMGVDLSEFARQREAAREARKSANSEVKRLSGAMDSTPLTPGLPDEEVSVAALTAELTIRQKHNAAGNQIESISSAARSTEQRQARAVAVQDQEIQRLKRALAEAMSKRDDMEMERDAMADKRSDLTHALASFEPADEQEILDQMTTADQTNRAIRDNVVHGQIVAELEQANATADKWQSALDKINSEESAARTTAQSRLPIEGISLDEDGVLYNNKPLSQAGTSAGIRISARIIMKLNEGSPIRMLLIDDGESIDPEIRVMILEIAHEAGFQVIMAVRGSGEQQVVIEDGVLAE